jgi:hypothetical protein
MTNFLVLMKKSAFIDVSVPRQAPMTKNGHVSVEQTSIYGKILGYQLGILEWGVAKC